MTQVQPQAQLKAIDFLDELPRRVLTDVGIDENLYRELVKGKSWDKALSILCDVEACGIYPVNSQPCQRWLRTLATAVAALARIDPEDVDEGLKKNLGDFAGVLGIFLLTGNPMAFTDLCSNLSNLRVVA
ncbi:MAG: hypothetical protein AT713_02950 [Caldivirga sp. JCHS_4]|jgi:hypothetical protein|nr:MAG: hypothetical protein AT713_02950 [Caldivirga sp. JCHS_4]